MRRTLLLAHSQFILKRGVMALTRKALRFSAFLWELTIRSAAASLCHAIIRSVLPNSIALATCGGLSAKRSRCPAFQQRAQWVIPVT
mmetsp:Transcript_17206/g.37928  ORF Transcript_17206/g.37928 Transcript_17206/m.37928 type:complete len:87 (-) Transcript_17206:1273-1533(-)